MSYELTIHQKEFIEYMLYDDSDARFGFKKILEADNFLKYFDYLNEKGFFKINKITSTNSILYLESAAKAAREGKDNSISVKILNVLRDLSFETNKTKIKKFNWIQFARVFSELSNESIALNDIDILRHWFRGKKFSELDPGIAENLLVRLLESEDEIDYQKAISILEILIKVKKGEGQYKSEIFTNIDNYSLKILFEKNLEKFIKNIPEKFLECLERNLKEIFRIKEAESWIFRPAIEDHDQNHCNDESMNVLIDNYRDSISLWLRSDLSHSMKYLIKIKKYKNDFFQRVLIYLLNMHYPLINELFCLILDRNVFGKEFHHELYELLKTRFSEFNNAQKTKIFNEILNYAVSENKFPNKEEADRIKRSMQLRLLQPIYKKGLPEADVLFKSLKEDSRISGALLNPEFLVYMYSSTGFTSPYEVSEITNFLEKNQLIEKLNSFKENRGFDTPSIMGLVGVLENAIKNEPISFINKVTQFYSANLAYQYGFISQYHQMWLNKDNHNALDWSIIWDSLFDFFEYLLDECFWKDVSTDNKEFSPNKSWMASLIADFLADGMIYDEQSKSFSDKLLPRAKNLISKLLDNLNGYCKDDEKDFLFATINNPKGKAIKALINFSLKISRKEHTNKNNHDNAWEEVRALYEKELNKGYLDNFEFYTLLGKYIEQLNYLSEKWLADNFSRIFPTDHVIVFTCALNGLGYSNNATKSVYSLLKKNNVISTVIKNIKFDGHGRKNLLQRLALAYVWGVEELTSPLIESLFNENNIKDLKTLIEYYYSISNTEYITDKKERILEFWRLCIQWGKKLNKKSSELLSNLGLMILYIDEHISPDDEQNLIYIAPYVSENSVTFSNFINKLNKLLDTPGNELTVLNIFFELLQPMKPPFWLYSNRLLELLKKLSTFENLRTNSKFSKSLDFLVDFDEVLELRKSLRS
ncbi:TPA: hypothetical protein I8Y89_001421 [Legionella pneumophila]|nr:hypothetical protein [Legionella pneumophila]